MTHNVKSTKRNFCKPLAVSEVGRASQYANQKGMFMSIPQCIIMEIPELSRQCNNMILTEYFLEIPVINCIVGMLLTCFIHLPLIEGVDNSPL